MTIRFFEMLLALKSKQYKPPTGGKAAVIRGWLDGPNLAKRRERQDKLAKDRR